MRRVLRLGSSAQYSYKRHEITNRPNIVDRNVSQNQFNPESRNFGRPVMLAGILGMLGFNREESEEDPITSTVKSAILSIQVDRQD